MKFDIIVSNPPYNKDIYLMFITRLFDMLKDTGVMVQITPAKFYAKGGEENENFRKLIVSHICNIHLYKDCTDIFDIMERGGIAYYDVFKSNTFDVKNIYNHSKAPALDDYIGGVNPYVVIHDEKPLQLMRRDIWHIIKHCRTLAQSLLFYDFDFKYGYYCTDRFHGHSINSNEKHYVLISSSKSNTNSDKYITESELNTVANIDKYKCIIHEAIGSGKGLGINKSGTTSVIKPIWYVKPNQIPKGCYTILRFCNTEIEAQSFCSYMNSQLINFIILNCLVSDRSNDRETFRLVPSLPEGHYFDYIYTNDEIFDIFKLGDYEKNMITSLIKTR